MQAELRREIGIDAFALDGDDSELLDSWADRPRPRAAQRGVVTVAK